MGPQLRDEAAQALTQEKAASALSLQRAEDEAARLVAEAQRELKMVGGRATALADEATAAAAEAQSEAERTLQHARAEEEERRAHALERSRQLELQLEGRAQSMHEQSIIAANDEAHRLQAAAQEAIADAKASMERKLEAVAREAEDELERRTRAVRAEAQVRVDIIGNARINM